MGGALKANLAGQLSKLAAVARGGAWCVGCVGGVFKAFTMGLTLYILCFGVEGEQTQITSVKWRARAKHQAHSHTLSIIHCLLLTPQAPPDQPDTWKEARVYAGLKKQ